MLIVGAVAVAPSDIISAAMVDSVDIALNVEVTPPKTFFEKVYKNPDANKDTSATGSIFFSFFC